MLALLAAALAVSFFVLQPFLNPVLLAMAFAVALNPLYARILAWFRERRGIAAFSVVAIVIIFILVPLAVLGVRIFEEASQLYSSFVGGGSDVVFGAVKDLLARFPQFVPASQELSSAPNQYLKQALGWLLQNASAVFSNAINIITGFFIFVIALYYFLKDGKRLKDAVVALSPLENADDEAILKKLEAAVNSVLRGGLAIALIQGVLTSAGFLAFGVPNPVLWGSAAAVAALIPAVGTALVVIPAVAFLFFTGQAFSAFGLLVWGMLAVGLIDNFLGPRLMGRGTELHPLVIFLSVLGGIVFFGPLGFLLGPLALSFLFALFDIYSSIARAEKRPKQE